MGSPWRTVIDLDRAPVGSGVNPLKPWAGFSRFGQTGLE